MDNYLKLEQVEYLRIDEVVEPQRYKYTFVDFANSFATDGTIQWKGRPQKWTIRDASVTKKEENGELIFRDGNGNVIDPD